MGGSFKVTMKESDILESDIMGSYLKELCGYNDYSKIYSFISDEFISSFFQT